jgi:type I restriction enzyme S subunit
MIDGLKPYPVMKNSGVPWLGEVPEHWEVLPNRALFVEEKERNRPDEQMLSVTITKGVIRQQALLADSSKKDSSNQDKSAYKLVRPGDIAYNKMRAWQGAIGASEYQGIVSPAYVVQRPREGAHPRYLHHLFRTPAFAKEAERWSYGITSDMWSLRPEHFKMIYGCLPPLTEQSAIVRYLDYMDRRIRRYIRAKQKLIELLNEQKQAIIHRAVTRGLDPNVRLKPSGVEWLGDVPEHWVVKRLRNLTTHVTSGSRGWSNYAADSGPLFIRIGNLNRSSIELDLSDVVRLNLPTSVLGETARTRVAADDILLSITAFIGSVAVVPADLCEAYVSQHVACCRLSPGAANARWLAYVLLSPIGKTHGALCMYGGTKQGLSLDDVKNHVVLLPPRDEQDLFVQRIENETATADAAVGATKREIDLLREYHTRLIADVVTGKLDVREAAARLPDEAEESEPLDDAEALVEGDESGEGADLDAATEEAEA